MNKIEKHKEICDSIHELYVKKNSDYGDSATQSFNEFGLISYIIRINDKLNRLKTLSKQEQLVENESLQDTLLDLAGYSIMAYLDMESVK